MGHPGLEGGAPIDAAARRQLALARSMAGDNAKAARQDFLKFRDEADPDIPILIQAKAEYAKLR